MALRLWQKGWAELFQNHVFLPGNIVGHVFCVVKRKEVVYSVSKGGGLHETQI